MSLRYPSPRPASRTAMAAAAFACLALPVLSLPVMAETAPPPGALSCGGCHGAGPDAALSLQALTAEDIAAALTAFADGSREGTLMPRIAKGFDAEEVAAIAAWIAGPEQ